MLIVIVLLACLQRIGGFHFITENNPQIIQQNKSVLIQQLNLTAPMKPYYLINCNIISSQGFQLISEEDKYAELEQLYPMKLSHPQLFSRLKYDLISLSKNQRHLSLLIETNDKDKEYYISLAIPENYNLTYEINIIGAFEKLCPFNCSEKGKCVEGLCVCDIPYLYNDCSFEGININQDQDQIILLGSTWQYLLFQPDQHNCYNVNFQAEKQDLIQIDLISELDFHDYFLSEQNQKVFPSIILKNGIDVNKKFNFDFDENSQPPKIIFVVKNLMNNYPKLKINIRQISNDPKQEENLEIPKKNSTSEQQNSFNNQNNKLGSLNDEDSQDSYPLEIICLLSLIISLYFCFRRKINQIFHQKRTVYQQITNYIETEVKFIEKESNPSIQKQDFTDQNLNQYETIEQTDELQLVKNQNNCSICLTVFKFNEDLSITICKYEFNLTLTYKKPYFPLNLHFNLAQLPQEMSIVSHESLFFLRE